MKKSTLISIIAAASVMLTGCSGDNNSDSQESTIQSSSSQDTDSTYDIEDNSENNSTPEPPTLTIEAKEQTDPKGIRTKMTGLDKHSIFTSQITDYKNKNGQSTLYSDDDMGIAVCEGFAYISNPSQFCYNSIDNADIFSADTLSFIGSPENELMQDFVRINVGDKVNGLTVSSAKTLFIDDDMGLKETALGKYFRGCECTFIGEMELTGYACILKDDGYGVQAGDIIFAPSGSCNLPVMCFEKDVDIGTYHTYYTGSTNGLTWFNAYGQIFLGNAQTAVADLSCLPSDGSFVRVNVVVKNISMSSTADWLNLVEAEIAAITLA